VGQASPPAKTPSLRCLLGPEPEVSGSRLPDVRRPKPDHSRYRASPRRAGTLRCATAWPHRSSLLVSRAKAGSPACRVSPSRRERQTPDVPRDAGIEGVGAEAAHVDHHTGVDDDAVVQDEARPDRPRSPRSLAPRCEREWRRLGVRAGPPLDRARRWTARRPDRSRLQAAGRGDRDQGAREGQRTSGSEYWRRGPSPR